MPTEYDGQIEKLQCELQVLTEENEKKGYITKGFDDEYNEIAERG